MRNFFVIVALLLFSSPQSVIGVDSFQRDEIDRERAQKRILSFLKESMGPNHRFTVEETEITGVYVASFGMQVIYLTGDLKFVFKGDLYNTATGQNVTLETKQNLRSIAFNSLDTSSMISFLAQNPEIAKKNIYVFTDVDCGYCRKFHKEVNLLNSKGINVHYLAFPRAGQKGETYNKMVSVWCSSDRNDALSAAKKGRKIPSKKCNDPISEHFKLGLEIELKGTPAVFSEEGVELGGFIGAKELETMLLQDKL